MKHVIFGGDGFVGRYLAQDLSERGEEVLVADISKSPLPHYRKVAHQICDVRNSASVAAVDVQAGDMVYNMSAMMLSPIQKRIDRYPFFYPVNTFGAANIMAHAAASGVTKFVQFTTDMVYGRTVQSPQDEAHPINPIGHYGASKAEAEKIAETWRERGMDITIIRPRLIIGPGRLGILGKLFKLIDLNLPVPMIGAGSNPYQFISVFDCAEVARLAWENGCPNKAYNLGSDNPPPVKQLLGELIKSAGSKSILLPTPGFAVKWTLSGLDWLNMPIMDPEQYMIADEYCVRDTTAAKADFGWQPKFRDEDMLREAYAEYRKAKDSGVDVGNSTVVAAAE
ncbi:MAG: NAD(P)-dependent oxidoreductase [Pseudomonadota bacterium]